MAEPTSPHLVLISMDTTRADALSCYGATPALQHAIPQVTPHLDAMSANGVRFAHFYSHAPTTLNSHTTMLTGLDPHAHGVPSNGFPYEGIQETLAQRLKREGYQTLAVVGSAALGRNMGLSRGFDTYDDRASFKHHTMYQDTAEGVVRRAFQYLDELRSDVPLFLFVHFYDPHGPLTPPQSIRDRFVDAKTESPFRSMPWSRGAYMKRWRSGKVTHWDRDFGTSLYLAEVSYMDQQIGRLLEGLTTRGFLERAVVVATADHGQNLTEHDDHAFSHGFDVHEEVMHIPLLIRGYGVGIPSGRTVNRHYSMSGLAPTIESLLGVTPVLGQQGGFGAALAAGPVWDEEGWPTRPQWVIPMEATRPLVKKNLEYWNNFWNQRGVRLGRWKLYHSNRGGPRENIPRFEGPIGLQTLMDSALRRWDEQAPSYRSDEMSETTVEALKALGYIESSAVK